MCQESEGRCSPPRHHQFGEEKESKRLGGSPKFCPEFSREKGKKERKGNEKRRKKGRRKKTGVGIHSNKVGFFPTWDILVYATQQFGTNFGVLFGHFWMLETVILV